MKKNKNKTIIPYLIIFACIWFSVVCFSFPPRLKLSHEDIYGSEGDMARIYYATKRYLGNIKYKPYEDIFLENTTKELLKKQGEFYAIQLIMEVKGLTMSKAKAYCDSLGIKKEDRIDRGIDTCIAYCAQLNRMLAIWKVEDLNYSSWSTEESEQYIDLIYPDAKITKKRGWQYDLISIVVSLLESPINFLTNRLYCDIETMEELKETNTWKGIFIQGKRLCFFFLYEILLRIYIGVIIYEILKEIIRSKFYQYSGQYN